MNPIERARRKLGEILALLDNADLENWQIQVEEAKSEARSALDDLNQVKK